MKTVGFGISESLAIKTAWGQFAPSTLDSLSLQCPHRPKCIFCFNSLFKYLTLRNTLRLNSKNYRSLQPYIIYFLEIISINYFLNCIFIELKTSITQVFPKMKHYILNYLFYMTPLLHYQELFHLMVVLTVVHF